MMTGTVPVSEHTLPYSVRSRNWDAGGGRHWHFVACFPAMASHSDSGSDHLGGRGYPRQLNEFPQQLEMVCVSSSSVAVGDEAEGYLVRQYEPRDRDAYLELFHLAFEVVDPLPDVLASRLDGGFFVVEHHDTGILVAACVAQVKPRLRYPEGGELGWLVADPVHAGRGLGTLVSALVTNRLADEGYEQAYLLTDDFRLPAISIYLKLGWQPNLFQDEMEGRWRAIFASLGQPFDPAACYVS
jgi:GNAT superfamily N-acetyltransferase